MQPGCSNAAAPSAIPCSDAESTSDNRYHLCRPSGRIVWNYTKHKGYVLCSLAAVRLQPPQHPTFSQIALYRGVGKDKLLTENFLKSKKHRDFSSIYPTLDNWKVYQDAKKKNFSTSFYYQCHNILHSLEHFDLSLETTSISWNKSQGFIFPL